MKLTIFYSFDFTDQLIYNYAEQLFANTGDMVVEHANLYGVERLALVIGNEMIEIVSGFSLGEACTLVLRNTTQTILDETQCVF